MNYENFNKIKWRVNDAISNRWRGRLQKRWNYLLMKKIIISKEWS